VWGGVDGGDSESFVLDASTRLVFILVEARRNALRTLCMLCFGLQW
jgi:hypothetical protein